MFESAPEKLYRISQTQFSISRHYGGCVFQGKKYIYNPKDDTLTREDIWKSEKKGRKKPVKKLSCKPDDFSEWFK